MITEQDYDELGLRLSREAKVLDGLHNYFREHRSRLYQACRLFELLDGNLGDVLEIGPFYSYTPFLLRPLASSYTVLEGDDPAVYPLGPLYQREGIRMELVDLFDLFGPTREAKHTLDFKDASFQTVLCWETMEHFNFNPVKFVRELHRVLRRGGRACVTVPNKASIQSLAGLVLGRSDADGVDAYFKFEDYVSNGKKAFFGHHWREYSYPELGRLFMQAGFKVRRCDTVVAFRGRADVSAGRRLARGASRMIASVLRRYGTHVVLLAEK